VSGRKRVEESADVTTMVSTLKYAKEVHLNVSQEVIITTQDKVRLCLNEHVSKLNRRQQWMTPLGMLIGVGGIFATSTFRSNPLGSAEFWKALFVLIMIICGIWFLWTLARLTRACTIEDVIEGLKTASVRQPEERDRTVPSTPEVE
jgi:hypothetical protein